LFQLKGNCQRGYLDRFKRLLAFRCCRAPAKALYGMRTVSDNPDQETASMSHKLGNDGQLISAAVPAVEIPISENICC